MQHKCTHNVFLDTMVDHLGDHVLYNDFRFLETDGTFQEQEPVRLNKRLHSVLFAIE